MTDNINYGNNLTDATPVTFHHLYGMREMNRHALILLLLSFFLLLSCSGDKTKIDELAQSLYSQSTWEEPLPPHAFKSDGCSCWPDSDWLECCIEHDLAYWMGGTRHERKEADRKLRDCISQKGYPVIAIIMYFGVRVGGVWWLPTPFRWGFGWDYPESGPPGKPY